MTATDDFYVVIGDKRDCRDAKVPGIRDMSGVFVVRMFIGGHTYDEEIRAHINDLHKTVGARMKQIAANPSIAKKEEDAEGGELRIIDAARPLDGEGNVMHPGHAVEIPQEVTR